MSHDQTTVARARKHLRAADPILRTVIDRVGSFRLRREPHRFRALVWSILGQQISGEAARTIRARLERLVAPKRITLESLAELDESALRGAGVSRSKARYLRDLVDKVQAKEVQLHRLGSMKDQAVIESLTQVTGIGEWTAHMFLMFSLGRWDVLPHGDLGIRMALRHLYALPDLPDRATCEQIARPWRPYATVASWYCWRSLDGPDQTE
jgi:DNA-3-methyladenine glycosylase II